MMRDNPLPHCHIPLVPCVLLCLFISPLLNISPLYKLC